jgi:hypothetical protein
MGKDYGEPHFEIATMGTEAILADSFRHDITQDTEYYDFILGILAGV